MCKNNTAMLLMIFQGSKRRRYYEEEKKHDSMTASMAAFQIRGSRHYSFKAFIIPSEDSRVGRINEEVHSTLVSGGFQVPAPQNVFSVDFHLVACLQLSRAYLSCTTRMIDDLGERSSALRADAAASS